MANNVAYKVVLLGDSGVGKTSIMEQFVMNSFIENVQSTIGAAVYNKTVDSPKNGKLPITVWDTAGQERYNAIMPIYIRGANAILFVFDLYDKMSLDSIIEKWIPFTNRHMIDDSCVYYLIGNKKDLLEENINYKIPFSEINRLCPGKKIKYNITSAKTGDNLMKTFISLVDDISSVDDPNKEATSKSDYIIMHTETIHIEIKKPKCCG